MLTEDYLMRYIRLVVAALQRAVGFRNAGLFQDALFLIDQTLAQLINIPTDLFRQMDDESILNMLSTQEELDIERIQLIADLTREEAEIYSAMKSPAESRWRMLRALNFYLVVAMNNDASRVPPPHEAIHSIVAQMSEGQLPPEIDLSLFDYFERQGEYYLADQKLTDLLARPDAPRELGEMGIAFYTRLLDLPVDDLERGGIDQRYIQKRINDLSLQK